MDQDPSLADDLRAAGRLVLRIVEGLVAVGGAVVFILPAVYAMAFLFCWLALAAVSMVATWLGLTSGLPVGTMSLILAVPLALVAVARFGRDD